MRSLPLLLVRNTPLPFFALPSLPSPCAVLASHVSLSCVAVALVLVLLRLLPFTRRALSRGESFLAACGVGTWVQLGMLSSVAPNQREFFDPVAWLSL